LLEPASQSRQLECAAESRPLRVWWQRCEKGLDEFGHARHGGAELVVARGVTRRVTGQLTPGEGVIVRPPQVVARRQRRERAVQRKQLEAVASQVELSDDLRTQQRHDVRAH